MIDLSQFQGTRFDHGKHDCYELARDYYLAAHRIKLPQYARPDLWWDKGLNLYMDNFRDAGFEAIHCLPRDIRVSDAFLMAVYRDSSRRTPIENRDKVANHCAIYVGQGRILHHFFGRLSNVETYKGLWYNTTVAVLRHKDVRLEETQVSKLDFMSLLPPAKRMQLERATQQVQRTD